MREFELADLDYVNGWLKDRGLDGLSQSETPPVGIIEPGVGVGFLLFAQLGICFVEGFITNPKATLRARRIAVHEIAKELVSSAANLGFRKCVILSDKKSLLRVGLGMGFKTTRKVMLMKDL